MKKQEFLNRVNKFTIKNYSITITDRLLTDWVHEGLVPGPTRVSNPGHRDPRWEWPRGSYTAVLNLCRAKKQGIKTFDELRIDQWLRGNAPLNPLVRLSMVKEHRRLQKRVYRPLRTDFGLNDLGLDSLLNAHRKRSNVHRALCSNKGDPRLAAIGNILPHEIWVKFYDAMRFGSKCDIRYLTMKLSNIFPALALPNENLQPTDPHIPGIGQIPEDDDETIPDSAESSLKNMPPEAFDTAREMTRCLSFGLRHTQRLAEIYRPDLSELALSCKVAGESMRFFPWNFTVFYILLHAFRYSMPQQKANLNNFDAVFGGILKGDLDQCRMILSQSRQTLTG